MGHGTTAKKLHVLGVGRDTLLPVRVPFIRDTKKDKKMQ
jgi:hypothetical protein